MKEIVNNWKLNILQNEPKRIDNKYSNELDTFIFKMLNKDPIKRPSSTECLYLIPPNYIELIGDREYKIKKTNSIDFSQHQPST